MHRNAHVAIAVLVLFFSAARTPAEAAPIDLISITRVNSDVVVTVVGVQGATYNLQRKLNITDPDWVSLSSVYVTSNGPTPLTDEGAINLGKAFYRVGFLPPDNFGYEFYAVPLSNTLLDRSTFFYAVALCNPGSSTASATITGGALGSPVNVNVAAGTSVIVQLPWVTALQNATTTVRQTNGAYRIVSTKPLSAYQYNPYDFTRFGMFSFTNDASLLLPVPALTGNYRVVAWPSFQTSAGMFAIAATQDATQVTIAPSTNIVPGGGLPATGGTITMNRGDVIQIAVPQPGNASYGPDPSGSLVTASKPVAVFGGHNATYIPATVGFADHLEEQLPPLETLRADMLVPRLLTPAGVSRKQFVKVVGTQNSTTLAYDPVVAGGPVAVNAGQVVTFEVNTSFRLTASAPILVARFMEGPIQPSEGGDPAMGLIVPFEQFRSSYSFVAPPNYTTNRLTVVAPTGTTVSLDGSPIPGASFAPVGASGYSVADVVLPNTVSGAHQISAATPIGITIYGYGTHTSYLYPGGTNLNR